MMKHVGLTKLGPADFTAAGMMNYDPNAVFVRPTRRSRTSRTCSSRRRPTRASSRRAAPARAASGTWAWPECSSMRSCPAMPSAGCPAKVPHPDCRTWSPAASSSPPARCRRPARWSRPARCGRWCCMVAEAGHGVPEGAAAQGRTGSDWTTGAWRGIAGPKGLPADVTAKLEAAVKKAYESQGIPGLPQVAGLRRAVRRRQGLRRVHGQGRQGQGRSHEGGGHRQIAGRQAVKQAGGE